MVPTQPPGWQGQHFPAPQPFPGPQYAPGGAGPTGFGYGLPTPGYFPGYPPRKAPPKKRWYGVGAALIIVGVAVAVIAGVGLTSEFSGAAPEAEHTFASGEMTTVHFDAGETKVIFIANSGEHRDGQCSVGNRGSSGDDLKLENYKGSLTINQWQAVFTVTAQRAADYTVTCEAAASDEFGVGSDAKPTLVVGTILAAFGGCFLFGIGIVALTVTAILRWRRKA